MFKTQRELTNFIKDIEANIRRLERDLLSIDEDQDSNVTLKISILRHTKTAVCAEFNLIEVGAGVYKFNMDSLYIKQKLNNLTPEIITSSVLQNLPTRSLDEIQNILKTHRSTGFWKMLQELFGIPPKTKSFMDKYGLFKSSVPSITVPESTALSAASEVTL